MPTPERHFELITIDEDADVGESGSTASVWLTKLENGNSQTYSNDPLDHIKYFIYYNIRVLP